MALQMKTSCSSKPDIESQRLKLVCTAKTVIIKIGSAVLADKNGLNMPVLESLAAQIAEIINKQKRKIILVSSGAVAAGRAALHNYGKKERAEKAKPALAAIGQSLLMQAWNETFAKHQILCGQVLLTRDDLRARERFLRAAVTFSEMLAWSIVPVVNENDTVSAIGIKFGDNDFLASLLVNLVAADLFVNLTSAPGVFDACPDTSSNAALMDYIPDISALNIDILCGSKTESGSGGMKSKLLAARRISQIGVPTLILPGREKNILARAFGINEQPQIAGTWICAAKKAIPRRKFWLAYQSDPEGAVKVDKGAFYALLYEGRSLLPGGITEVTGEFEKGALISVLHENQNVGVGFCNYSSKQLARICGRKRHEVAAELGMARYPDVIHRDNLLLDAAI